MALPVAWSASRRETGSPRRSSRKPSTAKKPTAAANAALAPLRVMATAASSPTAIGRPPPRGVGTLCDERTEGTSTACMRRSNGIVAGTATMTIAPLQATASKAAFADTRECYQFRSIE